MCHFSDGERIELHHSTNTGAVANGERVAPGIHGIRLNESVQGIRAGFVKLALDAFYRHITAI
jgi:hypothetical protein